jgi:hypothetical protein
VTGNVDEAVFNIMFDSYPATDVTNPSGAISYTVDYEILQAAVYDGTNLGNYETSTQLDVTYNAEGVLVEIEVKDMPTEFSPNCVYEASRDENGASVWSQEGCTFVDIDTSAGITRCNCTHLSRFTVIENFVADDPESAFTSPTFWSADDDTDFSR